MSDRKYRQSGYQEGGASERRPGSQSPRERPEGPRGRGLGAPTATVSKCARCGQKLDAVPVPEATCSGCGSDLHTCTNCRHFDSSAPNECRKPVAVRIAAKSERNECEQFAPKLIQDHASDSAGSKSRSSDAKTAFDNLFDF